MQSPASAAYILMLLALTSPWYLTGCGGGGGAAPPTVPGAVASFTAASGFALVDLTWTAPTSTGGSPITTYRVYRGDAADALVPLPDLPGTARTYQDASGALETTCFYAVAAVNAVGQGPSSTVRSAVPLSGPFAPGAVEDPTATAGDGLAAVGWQAPLFDGNSPITGYRVYKGSSPDDLTQVAQVGPTVTLYQDSSVTNDVPVCYAVAAVNAEGDGPMSDGLTVTPRTGTWYGLFVGVNLYAPTYPVGSLQGCVNDANGVRNSLLKDATRWSSANTQLLADADATLARVGDALASFASAARPGDTVVYFHSSHGGQYDSANDPTKTFLCCHDASFRDTDLAMALAAFRAGVRVIVIVDACHSGGLFKDDTFLAKATDAELPALPVSRRFDLARSVMDELRVLVTPGGLAAAKDTGTSDPLGPDVGWVTAADYFQYSYDGVPYGYFTGFLIDAFILGDAGADGVVSGLELADYVVPRAARSATDVQVWGEAVLAVTVAAATGGQPLPDDFEDDDASGTARTLEAGTTQTHTLHTTTDQDWVTFTLTETADVVLETDSVDGWGGDTLLTLYTSTEVRITSNDDGGTGFYSLLTRSLAAGTYLVQVRVAAKTGITPRPVEGYTLSLTVTPAVAP